MSNLYQNEIWKPIDETGGMYSVSNMGRIRSEERRVNTWRGSRLKTATIMTPYDNGHGYMMISYSLENKKRAVRYVHRLVAEAFLDNPDSLPVINHIDHDRSNNNADNLEWCTQRENVLYSSERMRKPKSFAMTNTGERYITWYKAKSRYGVNIKRKRKMFKTLEEAVEFRRQALGI